MNERNSRTEIFAQVAEFLFVACMCSGGLETRALCACKECLITVSGAASRRRCKRDRQVHGHVHRSHTGTP